MGKLLLVNPPVDDLSPSRSLALPMLASYVFNHTDWDVEIYDMTHEVRLKNPNPFREAKRKVKTCDMLGLSVFTAAYPLTIKLLEYFKEDLGELPFVVTGGSHPTSCPAETISESNNLIDVAVIGRGEIPLASMCNGQDLEKIIKDIPNVAYRSKKGGVKFTPFRRFEPVNERIDGRVLEFCYTKTKEGEGYLSEIAKFGCGNFCDYCSCVKSKIFMRSPEIIADEIAEIAGKRKINRVRFLDDNHFSDMNFLQNIEHELHERGVEIGKSGYLDLSSMKAGDTNRIMKLGYVGAFVGRDFITNRLAKICGRRAKGKIRDVEAEKAVLDKLVKTKLNLTVSYILPSPHYTFGEVVDTVKEMIAYSRKNIAVRAGPLTPFPGTAIRKRLQDEGLLDESVATDWNRYGIGFFSDTYKYLDENVGKWRDILRVQARKLIYFEKVFDCEKLYCERTCPVIYATATFNYEDSQIGKLIKNSGKDLGDLFRCFVKFSKDIDTKPEERKKFIKFVTSDKK